MVSVRPRGKLVYYKAPLYARELSIPRLPLVLDKMLDASFLVSKAVG